MTGATHRRNTRSSVDRPEVLSPGGSPDAIDSALAHGADAVYAGVGSLNARTRADNVGAERLPALVRYVRSAGARLYVALNVPVTRHSLADAVRTLAAAWLSGANAVILRDPILMRLAARSLAGMEIHASTQFGVLGPGSARRAAELGCTRAILARELSLTDIRRIHRAVPGLKLEAFFFGALCFGISGRCLLGEVVAGRSGNYGNCAQACRLEYFSPDGAPLGRIFSMKDLDLFPRIRELVDAGVGSLKIEGRMKSPAWVGCVTSFARTASEKWRAGGLSPDELSRFRRDVSILFSRPRTSGFLDGQDDAREVTCPEVSGQAGLPLPEFDLLPGGRKIRFVAPVDLALRDGLLVVRSSSPTGQGEALSIRELLDGRGRPAGRILEGQVAVVELPFEGPFRSVAIHSANSVEARYGSGPFRLGSQLRSEELPAPEVSHVLLASDRIVVKGGLGRYQRSVELPLVTQPARNQGMSLEMMQRYFPGTTADLEPGLYVNPTLLKEVRRAFQEQIHAGYATELQRLAGELLSPLDLDALPFQPDDSVLLDRGPACVSRVTGLAPGEVRTSGGDRFVIEPAVRGTVVRRTDPTGI